jgi:hypothetical protein
MDVDGRKFDALRAEQDGVLTHAQLIACGWTYEAIIHRRRREQWQKLLPGIVLTFSGDASTGQRFRAALLHGGSAAALTSCSAGAMFGMERIPSSELVHVAVPATVAPKSSGFVRVWPTTRRFTRVTVDGFASVTAARAVIDAGLSMKRRNDVRALVAEAVQRGKTSLVALRRELELAPVKGSKLLRAALDEVTEGARSAPEGALLAALRERSDLPAYELNADVHDGTGRWLACADVVFRAQRVIVEVDGAAWHLSPERWAADLARHTALEAAGWTVLRYPASRVLGDAVGVALEIAMCLAARRSA